MLSACDASMLNDVISAILRGILTKEWIDTLETLLKLLRENRGWQWSVGGSQTARILSDKEATVCERYCKSSHITRDGIVLSECRTQSLMLIFILRPFYLNKPNHHQRYTQLP